MGNVGLEELIEEGTEAFRGILEKLLNVAMQLERSEFMGGQRCGSQKADLPVGCVLNRGRVSAEPLPVSCRSSID